MAGGADDDADGGHASDEGDAPLISAPRAADAGGDTIARRTRTQFSLVDVPIDTLESGLPDIVEPLLGDDEQDSEYQRFLSSLLPHEQENLSFLDEEDDEYEPEDDEEEEDEEDGDAVAVANPRDRVTVKISKKELTDLLWDSTRLGLPLPAAHASADALSLFSGNAAGSASKSSEPAGGASAAPPAATPQLGPTLFQPPARLPTPAWTSHRPTDGGVPLSPPLQEPHGSVSQEQCIHLASQMHKHFQLLLQSFHMFAAAPTSESSDDEAATEEDAERRRLRKLEAMHECKKMMAELQARGEKAQQFKGELLAKLNSSGAAQEDPCGASRRVTRSVTAAHAAVSHPSMFELVGSQSLDELTSKLAASCTLQDRNRVIQEQMLEIDKHLLGTRRKNPKKPFTHAEDNLLAHGAKRFAPHPDSWAQIEKHFLPGKSPSMIQRRYRYLASKKAGMSAVKEYHSQFPKRRDMPWILEEDLRVARGMIEYHNDKRRFALVATYSLPHRTRFEIRRRWSRLRLEFYEQIAEQNPSIDDASIDFAVLLKDLLEDKLRAQVKQQSLELVENDADSDAGVKDEGVESATDDALSSKRQQKRRNASACSAKHLHPALFFTSWALANPASLLGKTCQHNLPSFVDGLSTKQQQEQSSEAALDTEATVAESQEASQSAVDPSTLLAGDFVGAGVGPAIGFPDDSEVARLALAILAASGSWAESKEPPLSAVESIESEPSTANTSAVLEDEEDDDSDYEHDELVSSDAEHDSDSDEFEQLELSDDDDDDDDEEEEEEEEGDDNEAGGAVFDYEELGISVDEDDDEEDDEDDGDDEDDEDEDEGADDSNASVSTAGGTASTPSTPLFSQAERSAEVPRANAAAGASATRAQPQSPSRPPIRYTLRLQSLLNPDNERAKRALEALERRIVGKSLKDVAVKPPAARPVSKRRIGLTEASQQKSSLDCSQPAADSELPGPSFPSSSEGDAALLGGVALGADAVPTGGADDFNANDFECEELLDGSSDEDEESGTHASSVAPSPGLENEPWQPNKKIKLLRSCSTCSRADACSCSSRRW